MTATFAAYDLAKVGLGAIDIGHIDIEYEWFLMWADDKVAIKVKYVNEVKNGKIVSDDVASQYWAGIIKNFKEYENMKTKRSIYNFLFSILSQIITFAVGIIIPRLFIVNLGSEANGLVSSVGQVFSYVGLLEAGIGATVTQALYKPIAEHDVLRINQILSASNKYYKKIGYIYIGCVCGLAVLYPLIVPSNIPTWQIVGVVVFSGLGNAINFLLQQNYVVLLSAEGRAYVTTNLNLIVNVLVSLAKVILLSNGFNIVAVVFAQFVLTLLRIVLMQVYIHRNYTWINIKERPNFSALSQRKYVMIQQLAYFVYTNTDIVILTLFCNLKVVSVYTIYNVIIGAVEGIVGAFTSSVVFALGQLYSQDRIKFKRIFHIYDFGYMTIVFSLFTTVYLCIIPFLSVYTRGVDDTNYLDSKLALLFVVLKIVTTLRSQSQNTVNFAGCFKETQKSAVLEALLNIVISIVGVYFMGIYGVLIGSIVSTFYRGITVTNFTNKHILCYTKKESIRKYVTWLVYCIIFIIIFFVAKGRIPLLVDNYIQWLMIAVPCTLGSILIYTIFWIMLDRKAVFDAWKIILSKVKRY